MIKRRKTLRRNEPTPAEKQEARIRCRERAEGMCELQCSPECRVGPLPLDGDVFTRGHLAHAKSKRRFGWFEDETVGQAWRWACPVCHAASHNCDGKPCPPK